MTMPAPADSPLIEAARQWYDAGYCVVPSHEDQSKRPFGQWKSYQTYRPTWEELAGWLNSGRYTGIGVICGAASGGAEMVEIEGPGDAAVERLGKVMEAATACGLTELMATVARGCVEQSAGGGLHMFIRLGDGPAKPNTKLGMAGTGPNRHVVAETRGEGGFVIVAPTPGRKGHPEGASYLFLQGSSPAGTPVISVRERDELHDLLAFALHEHEEEPEPVRVSTPATPSGPVAVDSTFGEFRARTTWRDILDPLGWRMGHTDAEGHTHWTRPGGSGFEGTSATTLEDGPMYVFSTSTDLPAERGLTKEFVYTHYMHGGDFSAASKALRESGYGTAPVPVLAPWEPPVGASDVDPDDLAEAKSRYVRDHFPTLDWHTLWADDTEEEWIVEPLLAARRLVALYSAPKVGKSLLMLELAAGIATGKGLLGNPPTEPKRTLYVDYENDPRGDIRERLINMGYGPGDLDNLALLSFPMMAALDTEAGSLQLLAAVEEYGCHIVVIDTVSRSIQGDENENDTWLNFYRHTGLKLKQAGVSLIRLDHSGKDESKGQRGGSAKSGDVDAVWRMSRVGEETFELVCEAQRFPIAEKHLTIRRTEDPVLRHVAVVDGVKTQREDLLEALGRARVPKDLEGSIRTLRAVIRRDYQVPFKNAALTSEVWTRYCAQPTSWTPEILGNEGS